MHDQTVPELPTAHADARASRVLTVAAHDLVEAVLAAYDFSAYERIADVGGGSGHLLKAILAAYEGVQGFLFELPEVAELVEAGPRLEVVAGDFFTDPLPVCDAYVLMNVIHDWDDEEAVQILSAVAAAGRGATVLLVEVIRTEDPQSRRVNTIDMTMRAAVEGRERTLAEHRALLLAAGMDICSMIPTSTPFSILEAAPR